MAARRPALNALRQRSFTRTSPIDQSLSATLGEFEPITMAPIDDIFDAPTKLGATDLRKLLHSTARPPTPVPSDSLPFMSPTTPPVALPSPLLFEGPARPRTQGAFVLTKPPRRTMAAENPNPSSARGHHTTAPRSSSIIDSTLPLPHTYDGPSQITRYRYSGQRKQNDGGAGKALFAAMGITTVAAGAAALSDR